MPDETTNIFVSHLCYDEILITGEQMKREKAMKLLYVDDAHSGYEALIALMEAMDFDLFHATSAQQAMASLKLHEHDILVCNLGASDTEGVALCRAALEAAPRMPIILIGDPGKLEMASGIGVDTCIGRPVQPKVLEARLKRALETVHHNEELTEARHMIDEYLKVFGTSVIFSKTDPQGLITYANDAFVKTSGYSREELIGHPHSIIRHPDTPKTFFKELWRTIKSGQVWKGIVTNRRKDGSAYTVESTIIPILDRDGEILEYMAIRHQLSDFAHHNVHLQDVANRNEIIAMERSREMMERLYVDSNTALPNNLALQRDLEGVHEGSLFLLDVNNFNIFNKLHGFAFGDKLLRTIGENLSYLLDGNERLYKLSADRYVILAPEYDEVNIDYLCNQIFAYFDNSEMVVDTIENQITYSIGVAHIHEGRDAIIEAEFALDISKRYGKRFKVVYNPDSEEFLQERESINWLNRTREFIYKDMIVPYYQPIVDVATREVYKYEALARVVVGDEVIPPQRFLNAASRLGLLTSVTKTMINKSFAEFSGTDTRFSINITERDIMDGYLAEFIKMKVEKYGIDPSNVTFEVLENLTLSKEGELVERTIALVKDYGCNIAIDDFGSENSNFGRILSLQSDYLKIDGLFVRGCDMDPGKQKIIGAIVQLAKRLGIKTVAEYVENEAIYETVKRLGVDYAQGYLFGMPSPMCDFQI